MEIFKVAEKEGITTIQIHHSLWSITEARNIWEKYSANKVLAMNMIKYAYYLYGEFEEGNPFANMNKENRKKAMIEMYFNNDASVLNDKNLRKLLAYFKQINSTDPSIQQIEDHKIGLAKLSQIINRFEPEQASNEEAVALSNLLSKKRNNATELLAMRKELAERKSNKTRSQGKLKQFYD